MTAQKIGLDREISANAGILGSMRDTSVLDSSLGATSSHDWLYRGSVTAVPPKVEPPLPAEFSDCFPSEVGTSS